MARTLYGRTRGGAVICPRGKISNCYSARLSVSDRDDPLYGVELAVATRRINAIIDELNAEQPQPGYELALIPAAGDEDSLRLVWRTGDEEVPEPGEDVIPF